MTCLGPALNSDEPCFEVEFGRFGQYLGPLGRVPDDHLELVDGQLDSVTALKLDLVLSLYLQELAVGGCTSKLKIINSCHFSYP